MQRIEPTVGRIVLFFVNDQHPDHGFPLRADICFVHDDGTVNLSINDARGHHFSRCNVQLVQDGESPNSAEWCEWMPYQKGQAAKTEQLEDDNKRLEDHIRVMEDIKGNGGHVVTMVANVGMAVYFYVRIDNQNDNIKRIPARITKRHSDTVVDVECMDGGIIETSVVCIEKGYSADHLSRWVILGEEIDPADFVAAAPVLDVPVGALNTVGAQVSVGSVDQGFDNMRDGASSAYADAPTTTSQATGSDTAEGTSKSLPDGA